MKVKAIDNVNASGDAVFLIKKPADTFKRLINLRRMQAKIKGTNGIQGNAMSTSLRYLAYRSKLRIQIQAKRSEITRSVRETSGLYETFTSKIRPQRESPPSFSPDESSKGTWQSNVWKGTGTPHFTCEVCSRRFEKKFDFTTHLFEHRKQEQRQLEFTCSICHLYFHNRSALNDHFLRSEHGCGKFVTLDSGEFVMKPFLCHLCPSKFSTKWYYDAHIQNHKENEYPCDKCNECFFSALDLDKHKALQHSRKNKKANVAVKK